MLDFTEIQHHTRRLIAGYAGRDAMLEEIRQMFHMEWRSPPAGDWIRETMSPSAYNAAIGAVRLMTSTEPHFNVAFDESDEAARRAADTLERAAKAMWAGSGRTGGLPAEHDVALSAVLSGEVCLTVTKTADLVALAAAGGNKGHLRRMQAAALETPYLFKVYPAAVCYPDFDSFGLRSLARRLQTTWGEVSDTWGALAEPAGSAGAGSGRLEKVTLYDYYDWECRCVWLEGGSRALYHEEHELDFIPVVAQITDGSLMFDRPDLQRFPLLYALWKSGLWKRENLSLTTIYSLIFALGSSPLLKRKTNEPGSPLQINRTVPGGVIDVSPDEDLAPLAEKVLDSSLLQGLQLAHGLSEESTLSKQALGAAPQTALAYSAISLLAQSGRLPLAGPRQRGGHAIAQAVILALKWLKSDGERGTLYGADGRGIELDPQAIPDRIPLSCTLEPDLPQDKLQLAQAGESLVASGLASKRWVRENILQAGQSDQMDKEIWMEARLRWEVEGDKPLAVDPARGGAGGKGSRGDGGGRPSVPAYPPGARARPGSPLSRPLPPRGLP